MNKRSLHTFIRNINGSLQSKQRYEIYTEIDTVIAMNFIVVIREKNGFRQIFVHNTYLQDDSPFGLDMHWPLFLHGDGAHDVNPENN